jgi:hypothetical protein
MSPMRTTRCLLEPIFEAKYVMECSKTGHSIQLAHQIRRLHHLRSSETIPCRGCLQLGSWVTETQAIQLRLSLVVVLQSPFHSLIQDISRPTDHKLAVLGLYKPPIMPPAVILSSLVLCILVFLIWKRQSMQHSILLQPIVAGPINAAAPVDPASSTNRAISTAQPPPAVGQP